MGPTVNRARADHGFYQGNTMAGRVQIKCINKSNRQDPHERITNVGGVNPDGGRWKMTQPQAIADTESGKYSFFVSVGGNTVDVIVSISAAGHKYLKTKNDRVQPDNLLSLPECP